MHRAHHVALDLTRLTIAAESPLPTRYGQFNMKVFRWADEPDKEHVAMVYGDVSGLDDVPIRMHSECLTSEVLGSLKCDCREQLEFALRHVAHQGAGVVLYLRQEGRGIGLTNKVRAYTLQARGVDTVDANRVLGLPDDSRRYDSAAAMLAHLNVRSVRLMTNNPEKVAALRELGVDVRAQIPVLIAPNPHSEFYLDVKRRRMNHSLPHIHASEGFDAE
ncbi:MAG: GTP cyclohydrolase II [Polyangiales bacterium]